MFDVHGIEIVAPRRKVFEFLKEPSNLPLWGWDMHLQFRADAPPVALEQAEGAMEAQRTLLQSELATLKLPLER
jgi:hypothetical protein